jgi:RND family efflux transporter MFP subunit
MSDRHDSIGMHKTPLASLGEGGVVPRRRFARRAGRAGTMLVLALVLAGAAGFGLRFLQARSLAAETRTLDRNYVVAMTLAPPAGGERLELPGTLQGEIESPIYARTSGYVLRWHRDIGARVAKGELLAELDTPEIDQQLAQAEAARVQAVASLDLARTSAERWEGLRQRDAVSQQELDERRSALAQAQANVNAARANVDRLRELEGFKRIVAPYAGVVTRRNVDVGDLVDAGNGGAARALFSMAQTDPLRVYVFVPQSEARRVHAGQAVVVTQSELPGRNFPGVVRRTAGAIDPATRTLQIEIGLPNAQGELLPGAFVSVGLALGENHRLLAPSNSLILRAEGPRVALVDDGGHVHLQGVQLGRDLGQSIEVLGGLKPGDRVVLNPPDAIADGQSVVVQAPAATAGHP